MSTIVLKNAYVVINSVDLSDHVKQVTINYKADTKEVTAMGDNTHKKVGSLLDWSLDVEFYKDEASGKVDQTLFPIMGSTVTIGVKPVNTTKGATNPQYGGSAVLESYSPGSGSVGDVAMTKATFVAAGDLSRATS